ncbi:MAG: Tat pathway signal protein [Phycisphaerae bacterium]|nr:Tat pathway signal protein [Phycisphaerae bacterium]
MQPTVQRRDLLKAGAAAAMAAAISGRLPGALGQASTTAPARPGRIWADLLHLSYNMWCDWDSPAWKGLYGAYRPELRFDETLWNDLLKRMVDAGLNMVVIDLGDGVQYRSHPEIAVRGAWPIEKLRTELARLRRMGLEPIPKMNFSATHDAWLGKYARAVSTDAYYTVCRDLIIEAIELFDKPRFFHLGMDEETAEHQREYQYAVIRQHDLWWHDFLFYVEQIERAGSRAWIWSDYLWKHAEPFFRKMPRSVLQSNWYYGDKFENDVTAAKAYLDLEKHGYEQVPTGSNWSSSNNFRLTVDYCSKHIARERLLGFLQTAWHPTLEVCRRRHEEAIDQVRAAKAAGR